MRNVRGPSARKFCARGSPKFRKFCNFFARFRRKICVISTPDARLFGCQRTHDLVKSFKDVMRVAAHRHAECMQFFVRAARRKFSEILQFFRAKLAQHLRDLDAKRELFQNVTHCRLVQLQRRFFEYAQRSLAGCTQFLRARPAGFPEILEFRRASLAENLRDIDAGRALFRIETHFRLVQEPQRHALVHAAHAGRFQATSLRAARQNSGKFAILSRDFCGRFARLRRVTRAFLHAQRTTDSMKSCNGVLWFA